MFLVGLRSLFRDERGLDVVGEACNGQAAATAAARVAPDVVVLGVNPPDVGGVEATRQILAAMPGVRVVVLSASADGTHVREMLSAGAVAIVPKAAAFEELAAAVRAVAAGGTWLAASVAGFAPGAAGGPAALTGREREVLRMLAEGRAMKQIAAALGTSVRTVDTHRRSLMAKLGLNSVPGLTRYAVREGIVSLGGGDGSN